MVNRSDELFFLVLFWPGFQRCLRGKEKAAGQLVSSKPAPQLKPSPQSYAPYVMHACHSDDDDNSSEPLLVVVAAVKLVVVAATVAGVSGLFGLAVVWREREFRKASLCSSE